MSVTLPAKWKPEKSLAIDMLVSSPETSIQEVADKAGVTKATIHNWLKDPEFVEIFYQKYMVTFGSKLPTVLNSMIREAEAGNVQAGRLVLEHSGKLIKRVEVNNHKSPFEKFLSTQVPEDADIFDDVEILPQRPVVPLKPVKITPQQERQEIKKNLKKNKKRREARRWRERAEAVGFSPPKQGRQTPAQRKEWQEKIIKREKALGVESL
jgi:AcrR family transcriptional regulator|tara:strand:- start:24 stop:653 length:630 start_codon:yes stop_codon:yes gene_type:complete